MALQKGIWLKHLVELLFANNVFLMKAFNADVFVLQGKFVHIPNASGIPSVTKNRAKGFNSQVKVIEDSDLKFAIDEFSTEIVMMPNADKYELSYDKRDSLLSRSKNALSDAIAKSFIKAWSPTKADRIIETTGKSVKSHIQGTTGDRKSFCRADVLAVKVMMDNENIPQSDRYMLIDAVMYAQLLEDLTEVQANSFLASADAQNGVLGKLYGFSFMMRSDAARYTQAKAPKGIDEEVVATDCAAALAWHKDYVCRAVGEHELFEHENSPYLLGDGYAFLVRAGGEKMSKDELGVFAIKQATA